ncbi:MAG: hypothetical protein RLZZ52_767 [Actinomycetota bacterium]
MRDKKGNLRRMLIEMPSDVKLALEQTGLRADYDHRPAYQRNDYLAWITRAVRQEIRQKRLNQMLDELKKGGVYMRMDHPASKK